MKTGFRERCDLWSQPGTAKLYVLHRGMCLSNLRATLRVTTLWGLRALDSFELNKMAGAVLLCLLIVMGLKSVSEEVFAVHEPEKMGYDVASLAIDTGGGTGEAAKKAPEEDLGTLLASANPDKGARVFRRCVSCHTIEQGGENKIGPNLYDIVGNHTAHKPDFDYSDAVKDAGKQWTYANLNHWITNPAEFIPGTKMAFAGIKKADQRADLLAYLAQNSPDAPPFPKPEEAGSDSGDGAASGDSAASE
jgi:cytochrome c